MASVRYFQDALYYNPNDGTLSKQNQPMLAEIGDIVASARRYSTTLPPGLLVGVAKRETNYKYNECDIDYTDASKNTVKKKTYGLFQMTVSEYLKQLVVINPLSPEEGACDMDNAIKAACSLLNGHLDKVISAANASGMGIRVDNKLNPPSDVWAYVCWLHNAGSEAITSINKYGMDWNATKIRNVDNAYVHTRLEPYADEVIALCEQFPLELTSEGETTPELVANSDVIETPLGDVDPFQQRLLIMMMLALGLIYIAWRYR
jgi:hypothetical protein